MDGGNSFAVVRKPSSSVEKAAPGAKRILSGMVADALVLSQKIEAEAVHQTVLNERALRKYADARQSLHRAAELGHTLAMYECWMDFMDIGDTYPQDRQKELRERAFHWLRKAAVQGHGNAQWIAGIFYKGGNSIFPQDLPEAYKWLKLAAEQDHRRAKGLTSLSSTLSSAQLQEGERRYREFRLSKK
jgi:TPR repeat protein